jgi:hypothetical protein
MIACFPVIIVLLGTDPKPALLSIDGYTGTTWQYIYLRMTYNAESV